MDPATSLSPSSGGGPVRRRQRDQEEKLPPHRVLWRDEVRAVKVGYDIAGTYVTNANFGKTTLLPPLYFLLEVAHGQQRRELEAEFELRTARMMQEQDDLRRQVLSLEAAKLGGIEKQSADIGQNRNGRAAASRSIAKANACTQAKVDDTEISLLEAQMREEIKGARIELEERLRVGEKGLEAHVAARAVKRDKALRSFIQKVQALEAKVARDEAENVIKLEKMHAERTRADSGARDAHSQGPRRLIETEQVSDEEEGDWVDVEERDAANNGIFEVGDSIVENSERVRGRANAGDFKVAESTVKKMQKVHSHGTNGLFKVVESAGGPKTQSVRGEKTCEKSQQVDIIGRESTKLGVLEASKERTEAVAATFSAKIQELVAELRAVRQKLRVSKEELRESMGAEVEAVLRVTEAEETTADLRLELEACKREIAELRKAQAPSHGQAQPLG